MSNEEKSEPVAEKPDPHAKWLKGPNGMTAIKLYTIQLAEMLDLPGAPVAKRVTAVDQQNVNRHRLHYLPWMRAVMVSYYPAGETEPMGQPTFIPESMCAWTPK